MQIVRRLRNRVNFMPSAERTRKLPGSLAVRATAGLFALKTFFFPSLHDCSPTPPSTRKALRMSLYLKVGVRFLRDLSA
jgi:hypothetical protein